MRVIGVAGWSGAGKTTLIVKLIPYLRERGITVSTLKHAHHAFDVDQPGKDSSIARPARARSSSPRPGASRLCMNCAAPKSPVLPSFCGA